ncbi:hypothetical protein ACFYL6_02465 [Micromonospora sp. NPDC007208]|uniref:hypothetical protein n=1 Tax=Micromonospora sp. NPDC007208 TaxID=3364236 RepID=UPI003686EBAB
MSPFAPKTCGIRASPLKPASAQSGSEPVSTREPQPVAALDPVVVDVAALDVVALDVAALDAVVRPLVGAAEPPLVVVVQPASRTDAASSNLPRETISPLPVPVDDSSHRHDTGRTGRVPYGSDSAIPTASARLRAPSIR